MPSRDQVRAAVAAKMRRGMHRARAQREAAADLGVALTDVVAVSEYVSGTYSGTPVGGVSYDSCVGGQ